MSLSNAPLSSTNAPSANSVPTGLTSRNDGPVGGDDLGRDETTGRPFVDRRQGGGTKRSGERRQFGSSHEGLTEPGRELALAIDQYKLAHHRRYITCDEMLAVIKSLGYSK